MSYLDESFELWLTGDGSAVDMVKEYEKKDKRIIYYGFLPTYDELRKIQSKATMMINMRDPNPSFLPLLHRHTHQKMSSEIGEVDR